MKNFTRALLLVVAVAVIAPSFAVASDAGPPSAAAVVKADAGAHAAVPSVHPGAEAVVATGAQTPAAKVEADPAGSARELVAAIRGGNWRYVAALALAFMMFLLSRVRDKVKWFKGDRGGAILVGILAVAGALSTALASSGPIDWRLLLGAAGVMWTAVGGYTWLKRLIWPADKKLTADKSGQ